jgi:hypothetical protein
MYKIILLVALATGVVFAQTKPSCSEALALTPGAFGKVYTQRVKQTSEAALDDAAMFWADCAHKANLQKLKNDPKLQDRVVKLRMQMNKLFDAEAILTYYVAGGGTLYSHKRARFQPDIEKFMQGFIPPKLTYKYSAGQYQAAQKELRAKLSYFTLKEGQVQADEQWKLALRDYKNSIEAILAMAPDTPENTAVLLFAAAKVIWLPN